MYAPFHPIPPAVRQLTAFAITDRSRVERRRHPGNTAGDFRPGYLRQCIRYTVQSKLPEGPQAMDCDGIPGRRVLSGSRTWPTPARLLGRRLLTGHS